MLKKLIPLSFTFTLILALSAPMFAQGDSKQEGTKENPAPAQADKGKDKAAKQARWEGTVVRSNKDSSTLTVRSSGSHEKIVHYDDSTKWVSQEHGSKTVNNIDSNQVTDGDRVIVQGTENKKGEFHATLVSRRLTPLPGSMR